MKIPYSWLKEYIDLDDRSIEDVAKMLTLSGTEVVSINKVGGDIPGVVVGKIISNRKHPDADKLSICSIDIGDNSPIPIVCGAQNVSDNIFVPVATVGSLLPNGSTIKKTSIRGFESNGMICSKEELGYEDESAGIWVLDCDDSVLGNSISTVIGTTDYILDLDVTTNRADLLSVLGIARECAILCEKRLTTLDIKDYDNVGGNIEITVEEEEACPRYSARFIFDVEIGPSPDWLIRRLNNSGVRSVNNVVDITNYVLLEYGQPLHAFDLDKVEDKKIIVRNARDGETLHAINGSMINLTNEMLVIADGKHPIAIAGVMGGLDTEISETTKNIIIESAYFEPIKVRKSSKLAGIKSDASYRFERGVDRASTVLALNRAVDLILNITKSGKIASKVKDVIAKPPQKKIIIFNISLTKKYLNLDLSIAEVSSIFKRFYFSTTQAGEGSLKVDIPSYRYDLSIDIDLLEEIARIYGYNNIETTRPSIKSNFIKTDYDMLSKIRHAFSGFGLFETKHYSIGSSKIHKMVGFDEALFINVKEPINVDYDILRPSSFVSLMNTVSYNKKRRGLNARFFELGNVFYKNLNSNSEELYIEKKMLSAVIYGNTIQKSWNEVARKSDIFDIIGIAEAFITKTMGIDSFKIIPKDNFLFIPFKGADINIADEYIGRIGQVHPKILNIFDIKDDVFFFEIDVRKVIDYSESKNASEYMYKDIGKYPSMYRDLALICSKDLIFDDVLRSIKTSSSIIKYVTVADRYEGPQVEEGKISIAISIVYNDNTRTLLEEDVNKCESSILEMLKNKFDIVLRS